MGGYEGERWYTAGGLLEVGGYLANLGHGIGEWAAQGGTVTLGGKEVVAQAGSRMNLAGGTLDVAEGVINLSWLRGADGRLYEASSAPADRVYAGLYRGYEDLHGRWGEKATRRFLNPVLAPSTRREAGYTVGRDAGRLVLSAPTAVVESEIVATVYDGARQTQARGGRDRRLRPEPVGGGGAGGLALGNYARWAGSTSSIPTSGSAATPISPWRWRRATRWRPSASARCGWTARGCPTWAWAYWIWRPAAR